MKSATNLMDGAQLLTGETPQTSPIDPVKKEEAKRRALERAAKKSRKPSNNE